ncbi:hypothetical protein FH972_008180 [Carpinus fangiana]|uniref:Uncharacterized protein n=1 Tax=Carpinus fangiana TaxID=176857 RepID=A0A5N6QXW2_9ROSI|nr:hypothetical protein FH972_008180 [Carpinus fangiana]
MSDELNQIPEHQIIEVPASDETSLTPHRISEVVGCLPMVSTAVSAPPAVKIADRRAGRVFWSKMTCISNQESKSLRSRYMPFMFLIGSVIGLLGTKESFKDHPANKWISAAALLILCLLQATRKMSVVFLSVPDRFWWLYFVLLLVLMVACHYTFLYTWICSEVKKMFRRQQDVLPS